MQPEIPLTKLWVHEKVGQNEALPAIQRVLSRGNFILGDEVELFEREFCSFLGVQGGTAVGSGTDAITLGLLAGGVNPGDEVIVPDFAPGATITGVLAAGATPVLVDMTEDFELDLSLVEEALSERTKAIIAVHLYGRVQNMPPILRLAAKYRLWVVEDCAHAHGAALWNPNEQIWKMAGTLGDVGAFSFYPTKNLGCLGDGGFVSTRSLETAQRLRELRQYGWRQKDDSERIGRNSRLDEIQAAVLRVALRKLADWNGARRRLAELYTTHLQTDSHFGKLTCFPSCQTRRDVHHLFVIRVKERDLLIKGLSSSGIGTAIHYPKALSQQTAYRPFAKTKAFPVAEKLAREVLSLPMYPALLDAEIEFISLNVSVIYKKICTNVL